ncbi:DUF6265 family protein [Daejeonella lutea]|uniref:DUF6265 domain-containing protein n=1 Tax=Daejeonella lutea TaxID=572036 RepID=A0A1T4ZXM7_9SPHI|nr:DUF6265 family protein [Daejeonella lutea]SKB27452.1 hypothetical protein SAMN05661099_0056 [Daejeonella lutea]
MKIKFFLSTCIAFSLASSMGTRGNFQTHEAEWLIGTWENKTSRGSMYESWKKVSNSELAGKSYMIRERDTVVFENIQLVRKSNLLIYIPTVNGQNNNQPVSFPMISNSDNKVVFENKNHDFPQLISYTRISKDSLIAEISGISKGVVKRQAFPMKRIR